MFIIIIIYIYFIILIFFKFYFNKIGLKKLDLKGLKFQIYVIGKPKKI